MASKSGYSRRDFLKIVGVGTGLAAAGCSDKLPEKIIPYIIQPDEVIPGVATWYAGSCNQCSAGCGVIVRTREGRAVKLEGNRQHPVNRGGLCAHGQSVLQAHYDPDRIREPLKREINQGPFKPTTWQDGIDMFGQHISTLPPDQRVVLLTNNLSGSISNLIRDLQGKIKNFEHIEYELFDDSILNAASAQCFGANTRTDFDFSQAKVIVSFGADFLETWISPVEFARQWAEGRKPGLDGDTNYFVAFEPRLSLTAANADRWVANAPGTETAILLALLSAVIDKGASGKLDSNIKSQIQATIKNTTIPELVKTSGVDPQLIDLLAAKLVEAPSSLVVAGGASTSGENAVQVAVLANLLNVALGNIGKTVFIRKATKSSSKSGYASLLNLIEEINAPEKQTSAKKVGLLIVSGTNPVYTLPRASGIKEAISKVGMVVGVSSHLDETTSMAHLILPLSSSLESWGDAEPTQGLFNLNQPAMQPLYQTQSLGDTLIALANKLKIQISDANSFYEYIQIQWKKRVGENGFEGKWVKFVEGGGDWHGYSSDSITASLQSAAASKLAVEIQQTPNKDLTLMAYPSVISFDGSSANRPWMQELPDPMTSVVWGSWIEVHPKVADEYGFKAGDVIQVRTVNGGIEAPLHINKYLHPNLIAVPIGQGHEEYGRFAAGIGANVLSIVTAGKDDLSQNLKLKVKELTKSISVDELVRSAGHDSQEGRGIIRSIAASELVSLTSRIPSHKKIIDQHAVIAGEVEDEEKPEQEHEDLHALGPRETKGQMYRQMDHPLYRWGMSIDLGSCTGCSACVVACYAENNVPVVGKKLFSEGREMSWIRIERYLDGPDEQPLSGFLPMMCQHCGNAPCEPVCPVYATYHNEEGLNAMVYNRCVGTRYCSNNCSYKVRRFNWFKYEWTEPLNWQLNPDVTVREVGIMEKCSFCVQRIREGENTAKNLGRPVKDGEIQPACASSCPTGAIKFGNLLDQKSSVYKESQSNRAYKVLDAELNTQPAISYLARVRNDSI